MKVEEVESEVEEVEVEKLSLGFTLERLQWVFIGRWVRGSDFQVADPTTDGAGGAAGAGKP